MTLQRWHKEVLGGLVIAVVCGLGGRFSGPTKTVEVYKDKEVKVVDQAAVAAAVFAAKMQWSKEVKDHTVVKYQYLDGKIVEKIVYVDRDTTSGGTSESSGTVDTRVQSHTEAVREATQTKTVEHARPDFAVAAFVKLHLGPPEEFAIQGDYRLLGPLWLSAQAQVDPKDWRKSAGLVGVKLEF